MNELQVEIYPGAVRTHRCKYGCLWNARCCSECSLLKQLRARAVGNGDTCVCPARREEPPLCLKLFLVPHLQLSHSGVFVEIECRTSCAGSCRGSNDSGFEDVCKFRKICVRRATALKDNAFR